MKGKNLSILTILLFLGFSFPSISFSQIPQIKSREVLNIRFEDDLDSVRWSPNKNLVAISPYTYSKDKHIYIYGLTASDPVIVLNTSSTLMAWSHDGQYFATVHGLYITLWNIETGEPQIGRDFFPLPNSQGYHDIVTSLIWSPDDEYVGFIADGKVICLWQVATDEIIYLDVKLKDVTKREYGDVSPHDRLPLDGLSWQPNNKTLAVLTDPGYVGLFDAETLKLISVLDPTDNFFLYFLTYNFDRALDWHPIGNLLAVSHRHSNINTEAKGSVMIWNTIQQKPILSIGGPEDDVFSLEWNPHDTMLAGGGSNGIQIWDSTTYTPLLTIDSPEGPINAISWSHDGKYLASVGPGGLFRVWEITRE